MTSTREPSLAATAIMLGLFMTIAPASIDAFLPAMRAIARDFGVATYVVEFSLPAIFIGNAIGQLFYGPLADRLGRKPVMLGAAALWVAACIGSASAPNVEVLVAWRFVQGLAMASSRILSAAAARDMFERERLRRLLTYIMLISGMSPIVSVNLGGILVEHFGWRAVFGYTITLGVVILIGFSLAFRETLPVRDHHALRPTVILRNYSVISRNPHFLLYVLCGGFQMTGMIAFLNSSPGVLIGQMGVSPTMYSVLFSVVILGFFFSNLTAGQLVGRIGMTAMIVIGTVTAAVAGIFAFGFAVAGIDHWAAIIGPMVFFMAGFAITLPQVTAGAMMPFPDRAGAASSVMGFIQMLIGASGAVVLGLVADGTQMPMVAALLLSGLTALAAAAYIAARIAPIGAKGGRSAQQK